MATKQEGRVMIQEPGGSWVESILPESPAMATFLEAGYGMSLEKAQTIIAERPKTPGLWPYEMFEKAQAFDYRVVVASDASSQGFPGD